MKYDRPLVTHTSRFQKKLVEGPIPEFDPSLGPCLLWTGGKTKSGYGTFMSPSGASAHRFAWEDEHGELPDTHEVHHRCRVRLCVRLEHLEPLTVKEHIARHQEENAARRQPV